MEELEQGRPRSHACSESRRPPPIAPRREGRSSLALRRHHSSNPDYSQTKRLPAQKSTESEGEYDRLHKILLRHSASAKSRSRGPEGDPEPPVYDLTTTAATRRPRSQTQQQLIRPVAERDEDIYLAAEEIATLPNSTKLKIRPTRSSSPLTTTNSNFFSNPVDVSNSVRYATHPQRRELTLETAIYGVAQGKGSNLVMDLKELQTAANNLYRNLLSTNSNSPELADLRMHLRTGDKAPTSEILQQVYQTLRPPDSPSVEKEDVYSGIYHVDFCDCKEKTVLREKILQLFTLPGPPSVMYQKVTAKLDALIHSFVDIVIKMRLTKNETLTSPYHAQSLLQNSGQEGEHLVRVLQSNELWIRWGTETGLPPLPHIYMLKHPPSYEMRKAIVLSGIAEKRDVIDTMLTGKTRLESFIPPIYSKLEGGGWQVTEYDPETRKMETRKESFPLWVEECSKLASHLKSGNRSTFEHGDHIYALYSVYLVVVKDITLAEGSFLKESRMPCSHQIFVGSCSTGVLYRFLNVEKNHCESISSILHDGPTMTSYRCHQEIELVEACLALSLIRRQPRAVFVINSFQEGDMTNLSLNKKKPYHDKMINLEQHYMHSKKLGPTNDMRYGMNRLGDTTSP